MMSEIVCGVVMSQDRCPASGDISVITCVRCKLPGHAVSVCCYCDTVYDDADMVCGDVMVMVCDVCDVCTVQWCGPVEVSTRVQYCSLCDGAHTTDVYYVI